MKLKDETGGRIKEKLDKLKTRIGHKKLLSDILFPSQEKEKARHISNKYADVLDEKIKTIEPLIRSMRSHIDYIGDPDKFVAAYLLIGKCYASLKAIAILVRHGFSYQIVELVRSSIESLDLASLFFEEDQEDLLKRWFNGEIVGNRMARGVLDAVVNKMYRELGNGPVPMKDALTDIYFIYSSYVHSGYAALFDYIDVFKEDFDFEQYSQFHFNRKNLGLIDHLYINILLGLKNFYVRAKDKDNLGKVEALLKQERGSFATPEEIGKEMQRYR